MLLLSFLGEQPIPVLLPLWSNKDFTAICLVPTERTEDLAQNLTEFIENDPKLSHVEVVPYFKISAYNLEKARRTIMKLITQIQPICPEPVCINLTGGTKIMSLAGMMVAYELGCPMIYVATEENAIIHIAPGKTENEVVPLDVKISIAQYFAAYGIETSLDHSFANPDKHTYHPTKEGDWLEDYVYKQALESGFFDNVQKGLFIRKNTHDGQPIIRELDVVVIKNGRMAVCSCKAGKYRPTYLGNWNRWRPEKISGSIAERSSPAVMNRLLHIGKKNSSCTGLH